MKPFQRSTKVFSKINTAKLEPSLHLNPLLSVYQLTFITEVLCLVTKVGSIKMPPSVTSMASILTSMLDVHTVLCYKGHIHLFCLQQVLHKLKNMKRCKTLLWVHFTCVVIIMPSG